VVVVAATPPGRLDDAASDLTCTMQVKEQEPRQPSVAAELART